MPILYTIGCVKCNILKDKLDAKNIAYETVTDQEIMKEKGIDKLPVLEVNGELMEFSAANNWVNSQEG